MSGPKRIFLCVAAVAVSVACWVFFYDGSPAPSTAVLGGYRSRWFLLGLAVSYASLWYVLTSLFRFGRTGWLRILSVHISVVFLVGLLEAVAVAGLVDYSVVLGASGASLRSAKDSDPRLRRMTRPNLDLRGRTVPDLARIFGLACDPIPVEFHTDSHGLRNSSERKDPRVICLGDSMLVAGLLPADRMVTELLGASLGVEVLNVSESTYAPQEELIRLETTGIDPSGRVVVHVIFEGNDLTDSKTWRAAGMLGKGRSWPTTGLVHQLVQKLQRPRGSGQATRYGLFKSKDGTEVPVHCLYDGELIGQSMAEWPRLAADLRRAAAEFRAKGVKYRLVYLPCKLTALHPHLRFPKESEIGRESCWRSPLAPEVAAFAKEQEIPFLDLTDALRRKAAEGELPYFTMDTHLNAAGHAALHEALLPFIRDALKAD